MLILSIYKAFLVSFQYRLCVNGPVPVIYQLCGRKLVIFLLITAFKYDAVTKYFAFDSTINHVISVFSKDITFHNRDLFKYDDYTFIFYRT